MLAEDRALLELGELLLSRNYQFVTGTPETHRRVVARRRSADSLRDIFGFSLPFQRSVVDDDVFALLERARVLAGDNGAYKSRVRFSTLGAQLYVHSAYPTTESDGVFFGPDTYRFAAWLKRAAPAAQRAVDVGCGSGAGVFSIAARCRAIVLADINPRALRFATINARLARIEHTTSFESDGLKRVPGMIDLVVSNPPYIIDDSQRMYRDGVAHLGCDLARRIAEESVARLSPGGTLLLYTGTPVVAGQYVLLDLLARNLKRFTFEELDPDVFQEELDRPAYRDAERIAVLGIRIER